MRVSIDQARNEYREAMLKGSFGWASEIARQYQLGPQFVEEVYREVIDSVVEEFRSAGRYYNLILILSWGLEVFDEIRKGANPKELWVKCNLGLEQARTDYPYTIAKCDRLIQYVIVLKDAYQIGLD